MPDEVPTRNRTPTDTPGTVAPANPTRTTSGNCPECDSPNIDHDGVHGESVCIECGLVISEDELDHGPDWRSFNAEQEGDRRRVGLPRSPAMHDYGLSTRIGQYVDGRDNQLSQKKKHQFYRLRKFHRQSQAESKQDRNLRFAFGELSRMCSALGLPKSTQEIASTIHRRAVNEGLLPGRAIEPMTAGALYAACKIAGTPRSRAKVMNVMRASEDSGQGFDSAYKLLKRELNLEVPVLTPRDHIDPILSTLVNTDTVPLADQEKARVREPATHILSVFEATPTEHISGYHPIGITAATIYLAARTHGDITLTQAQVSEAADVSPVTVRQHIHNYQDAFESLQETTPSLTTNAPAPPSMTSRKVSQ